MEIEFSISSANEEGEAEEDGNQTETEATARARPQVVTTRSNRSHLPPSLLSANYIRSVTIDHINAALGSHGPRRRLLFNHFRRDRGQRASDDDDDEFVSGYGGFVRRRGRPKVFGDRFPKTPSEQGKTLMDSGTYGCNEHFVDRRRKRKNNVSERLLWRRLGLEARGSARRANRLIAQDMVPATTPADKVIQIGRASCRERV